MQKRNILLIMIVIYSIVVNLDFMLSCSLISHPEFEGNEIARYLMINGLPPFNLLIPYFVILILFVYGYGRFYFDPKEFLKTTNAMHLIKYKIYYFNTWKMFLPMYFMMIFFISGHTRGIISFI